MITFVAIEVLCMICVPGVPFGVQAKSGSCNYYIIRILKKRFEFLFV
jgi:hypothetical protein